MTKFEYKEILISGETKAYFKALNREGREGWELISSRDVSMEYTCRHVCLFKRIVQEEEMTFCLECTIRKQQDRQKQLNTDHEEAIFEDALRTKGMETLRKKYQGDLKTVYSKDNT